MQNRYQLYTPDAHFDNLCIFSKAKVLIIVKSSNRITKDENGEVNTKPDVHPIEHLRFVFGSIFMNLNLLLNCIEANSAFSISTP